jgi:hypothetical protein
VNPSGNVPGFSLVGEPRAFTYHRALALPSAQFRAALPSPQPWALTNIRDSSDQARGSSPGRAHARASRRGMARDPGESCSPGDHRSGPRPDDTASGNLLKRAEELANLGHAGEAISACEQHLRTLGPARRLITC